MLRTFRPPRFYVYFHNVYLIFLNAISLTRYFDIVRTPTHQTLLPPWAVPRRLQPESGSWARELKYAFPGAGTSLLKSPRKSLLYTFLGFSMLATGSCCCCCAHKDTALPDGETPWPWRTNGVQNRRFPGPERPFWNLLEKVATCYTC